MPTSKRTRTASSPRELLRARVAAANASLIATTRELVRVASPNPPSDTREVARVAERLLAAIPGIEITRVEPEPRVVSLVARIASGRPGRRLIFNGHLDTFPLLEHLAWTVDPLGGELNDGRLFGRGVADMKGGIACSILAASLLAGMREAWRGEIVLTLAGDEENMGSLGTGYLLEHHPLAKGDAVICGDVGSPMVARFGEKGLLWIDVEAVGKPAHGAHVHNGINAIDRLRGALDRLKALEDLRPSPPAAVVAAIDAAAAVSEPLSGRGESSTLKRLTVNIGTIGGGTSPNLVPVVARASADIRIPIGLRLADVEAEIEASLGPLDGVSFRITRRFEPSATDPGHEIVQFVLAAGEEVLGRRPVANMRVGGSDARWYRMHAVPTVVYGPTPYNMGGADEHVVVDELGAVAAVHALAAFDFLQGS